MGLEKNGAALLLKMWMENVRLGRFISLGRQNVHLDWDDYATVARRLGIPFSGEIPTYMDDIIKALGATSVESMDFSSYEGAALVHDLNQPVPKEWHESVDTLFDGGSLEHVFNFPTAIANCMNMVRAGGQFVMVNMANNYCGHGFYQFSPELFFRIFSPANGFSVVEMYLATTSGEAFLVKDPEEAKGRVELCCGQPILILLRARRDRVLPIFERFPQQSDYVQLWKDPRETSVRNRFRHLKKYAVVRAIDRIRRRILLANELKTRSLSNKAWYAPASLRLDGPRRAS